MMFLFDDLLQTLFLRVNNTTATDQKKPFATLRLCVRFTNLTVRGEL